MVCTRPSKGFDLVLRLVNTLQEISIFFILIVFFDIMQVDLLKNKFGFDEAFNYKEESDLNAALKRSVYLLIA
jgi:hypothetical protein